MRHLKYSFLLITIICAGCADSSSHQSNPTAHVAAVSKELPTGLPEAQIAIMTSLPPLELWTPTKAEAKAAEKAILDHLRSLKASDARTSYIKKQSERILTQYSKYRLQIIGGFTRDTKGKYIWFNYIPMPYEILPGEIVDQFPDWKTELVAVEDGGISFWEIKYDVETKSCRELRINFET
ncbi:hypothetical protein ACFLS1_08970 [Verrucomicrobiota bacterium]